MSTDKNEDETKISSNKTRLKGIPLSNYNPFAVSNLQNICHVPAVDVYAMASAVCVYSMCIPGSFHFIRYVCAYMCVRACMCIKGWFAPKNEYIIHLSVAWYVFACVSQEKMLMRLIVVQSTGGAGKRVWWAS